MEILAGILGAVFASFLNALAYRLNGSEKIQNIWTSPSHCEVCKKKLRWYDLIPVISFLITGGKCSHCGNRVYWYYPVSELFLALAFAALTYCNASSLSYISLLALFFLSYFDIVSKTIPKDITDAFFILSMAFAIYEVFTGYTPLLLVPIIFAMLLFIAGYLINRKKEIFGMGDIIVLSSIILVNGIRIGLLTLSFTIVFAGMYAIGMVIRNRKNMKKFIPLIPFITIAYVIAVIIFALQPSFIDILIPLW